MSLASIKAVRKFKAPVALLMILLLMGVKAMVASEALHEAVCEHGHASHGQEQKQDAKPQHECVVKVFAQGAVDLTDSSSPVPAALTFAPDFATAIDSPVTGFGDLLPPGRAPPVSVL